MANYNIYVGIIHEATYIGTLRNTSYDEAMDYAYEYACETYESYAGFHGIPSWEECHQEIEDTYAAEIEAGEYDDNDIDDFTEEEYREQIESWTEYFVLEETSDLDFYNNYSKPIFLN